MARQPLAASLEPKKGLSQNGYGCCGCGVLQFERSHLEDARLCLFWIEPVLTRRPPTMSTPKIQYLLALRLEGFIDRANLDATVGTNPGVL